MNKAIIIGSGIAGLATAARLLSKGYDVSIFEAGEVTGGKIHSFNLGEYRFDAGPSLFTLPYLVDELFENLGENPRDHFNYIKKKVHCQYFWNDGNTLTAYADVDRFGKEVKKKFGVEPKLIQQYLLRSKKKYDLTEKIFLTKSLHSLSTYFSKDTLKAIFSMNKLDIFKSLHATNERLINEPHLIQLYDRYATYNGSNPYETSGIMSMIQHLESHYGTWVPKGGMVEISRSITDLLKRKGAKIFLNSKVEEITTSKNAVSGIIVNGEQIKADYAISNMDIYYSYEKLLSKHKTPKNVSEAERSSSALIFYWGIKKTFENLDLHNILFSENYQQEFEEIFKRGRISSDPTIYINITSKDIPSDAPTGCENWFVMVNAPHDQGQNWNEIVTELKRVTIQKINRLLDVKIENYIEVEKVYTPKTIEQITRSYRGSLYGTSSNSRFSAFLRHPNHTKKLKIFIFAEEASILVAAFHFACYPQKLYPVIFQMLQNKLKYNLPLYSSIIIWTFQIFGLIGILFWNSQWFINATPLCLMIYFGLVISNGNSSSLSFISIAFLWGLLAEIIGVQTGILFGSYAYGETLGLKIFGAPLVIGLNWVTTVIICASIVNKLKIQKHYKILTAIALMLLLDFFIEPVAPKMDMWSFSNIGHAPLSNYVTWALVALPLQLLYFYKKLEFSFLLSMNLYISQLLFFIALGLAL